MFFSVPGPIRALLLAAGAFAGCAPEATDSDPTRPADSDPAETDSVDDDTDDTDDTDTVDGDTDDTDPPPDPVDPADLPTEILGFGVTYQQVPDAPGDAALVLYGGWRAEDAWVLAWIRELYRARLRDRGVRHLYAVRGPAQADYSGLEIQNSRIARHLVARGGDAPIFLVAHSSGSFVAHELVAQLAGPLDPDRVTAGRLHLVNLDGGGSGLTPTLAAGLADLRFVLAEDPPYASANASTMRSLAASHRADLIAIDASDAGCDPGARWCLHDAVVIARPHNPQTYDLEADYTRFDPSRPVVTRWLDP